MRRGGRVPNVIANTGIVRALAPAACVQKHPHASAPGCARTTSNACGSPTTIFRGTRTLRRRQASTAPLGTRHSPSHPVTRTRRHSRPAGRCSGGRLPPSLALVSRACLTSSTFDWVSGHVNTGRTKKKMGIWQTPFCSQDRACGPAGSPTHTQHRAAGRLATCCWMLTGPGTFCSAAARTVCDAVRVPRARRRSSCTRAQRRFLRP